MVQSANGGSADEGPDPKEKARSLGSLFKKRSLNKEPRDVNPFCLVSVPIYIALLHTPVINRNGAIVTTSVTNMDIHDLARSARTYGVRGIL